MRIRRLDLLRYGCFTDVQLELPLGDADLHIVFGQNEAGKSTALSALEDLLFGIPHNSSLNFLHDYAAMRVGAVLQRDGEILEARRRKGNKDTLLTQADLPMAAGDLALAPFLDGADRSFFVRMFSLDHERLRRGGEEILHSDSEIGEVLFSAGAGIAGLRERLKALEKEADALWASRRAAHRTYYHAEDRLKAADNALRQHSVSAKSWLDLKRDCESSSARHEELEQEIMAKEANWRKLGRVRRVHRYVRRKTELDAEIATLGDVKSLPEDALQKLEIAKQVDNSAVARVQTFSEQLDAAREERAGLRFDEVLLLHERDIERLRERRIQVRQGKSDLPKRRAELSAAEGSLRRLARELEWSSDDIDQVIRRIPARSKVTVIRTLLGKRGGLVSAMENARSALEEAEMRQTELSLQLAQMGAPMDVSRLAIVIKSARDHIDIASRIKRAVDDVEAANAAIRRRMGMLKPEVSGEGELVTMPVPPRDSLQAHRDLQRDWEQRLRDCRSSLRNTELELDKRRKARARLARSDQGVPIEELARAREHRDRGWSLVRRCYVNGDPVPEEEIRDFLATEIGLVEAYEGAVSEADGVADRRFDRAEATARLAEMSRAMAEQEEALDKLGKEEEALQEEGETLKAAWLEMWAGAPFSPLSPDAMIEWATTRIEVLAGVEQRDAAERQVARLKREEAEAKRSLLVELEPVGVETTALEDQPLAAVVDVAAGVQRLHEQERDKRQQAEEELRRARSETERRSKSVEKSAHAWSGWEREWGEALVDLGLALSGVPEAVGAQLDTIDEMREIAVRVNELRHERVEKIELDISTFDQEVRNTVGAVARDLAGAEPEEAVVSLERRLENAKRVRKEQKDKDVAIGSLEKKIAASEESRYDARNTIRHLQETAGVEDIEHLHVAIEKSESLRNLRQELAKVEQSLDQGGDGLSLAELRAECDAMDLDEIVSREQSLEQELSRLREDEKKAWQEYSKTRDEFEAIGGDDCSARAAVDRQAALAEMSRIAEQYVRVRPAVLLLRWAIDRFRSEKQAPLLMRAGKLFSTLTQGSFSELRPDFDDQDRMNLMGVRPDGGRVAVSGMSTGSADQLYLALRLASVEDYLERATRLPFVADNLFINFDDERAAAGFEVLAHLARKTQVIFFTHHWHLVELARRKLGDSISVIALPVSSSAA